MLGLSAGCASCSSRRWPVPVSEPSSRSFLRLLRDSPRPAVVHVLGSCRDVAMAAELEPELFAAKCAALYLNAGSGTRDPEKAARLE